MLAADFPAGWFVEPLARHGHNRRPHYYLEGQAQAICGLGQRGGVRLTDSELLGFDRESGRTFEPDPRIGEPQYRRACRVCDLEDQRISA